MCMYTHLSNFTQPWEVRVDSCEIQICGSFENCSQLILHLNEAPCVTGNNNFYRLIWQQQKTRILSKTGSFLHFLSLLFNYIELPDSNSLKLHQMYSRLFASAHYDMIFPTYENIQSTKLLFPLHFLSYWEKQFNLQDVNIIISG